MWDIQTTTPSTPQNFTQICLWGKHFACTYTISCICCFIVCTSVTCNTPKAVCHAYPRNSFPVVDTVAYKPVSTCRIPWAAVLIDTFHLPVLICFTFHVTALKRSFKYLSYQLIKHYIILRVNVHVFFSGIFINYCLLFPISL